MDTEKLRVLLKVVETGNMTRASEELNYTQSGISHIVKALEAELGFPLLMRSRSGVLPTEDCKALLPTMKTLVNEWQLLKENADSIKGLISGRIRIGSFTSISVNWLPRIIKEFHEQYPDVLIEVSECGDQALTDGLSSGIFDVAFGRKPEGTHFAWIPLFDDQLMLIASSKSELDNPFPVYKLDGKPFIGLMEQFDKEVQELFADQKVNPDTRISATDDYTIISMVEAGLGMSILPEMVLKGYRHCHIQAVPLEPSCIRTLGAILPSMETASPAIRKFLESTENAIILAARSF